MLSVEGCDETELFKHLCNYAFHGLVPRKCIGYDGHLFFQNVWNFIEISEIKQKVEERSLDF